MLRLVFAFAHPRRGLKGKSSLKPHHLVHGDLGPSTETPGLLSAGRTSLPSEKVSRYPGTRLLEFESGTCVESVVDLHI